MDQKIFAKSKGKIYIVEDDEFLSRAMSDKLKREGFDVVTFANGSGVLNKAKEARPDLILLDLVMPEKNGFEVLKEIKEDGDLKSIPIIVLSNLGQSSDIRKVRELGATDYFIKSDWSLEGIVEKIKEHLAKS